MTRRRRAAHHLAQGEKDVNAQKGALGCKINELPSELLIAILERCIEQQLGAFRDVIGRARQSSHDDDLPYFWSNLAGVCHLWREICFNTPQLCNRVVLLNGDLVKKLLRRSGQLPVEVVSNALSLRGGLLAPRTGLQAFQTILAQFGRVVRAELAITTPLLTLLSSDDLVIPSETRLQELVLNFQVLRMWEFNPSQCIFPRTQFPTLQRFTCIGGYMGICCGLLGPTLKTLALHTLSFALTVRRLATYLLQCPNLEELVLRATLAWGPADHPKDVTSDSWIPDPTISLPHLRTISITAAADLELPIYLLHHMLLPSDTLVSLTGNVSTVMFGVQAVSASLRAWYARRAYLGGRGLDARSAVLCCREWSIRLALWRAHSPAPGEEPIVCIDGVYAQARDYVAHQLLSGLRLRQITALDVRTVGEPSTMASVTFGEVLATVPALEELRVLAPNLTPFVRPLEERDPNDGFVVPRLKTLHLNLTKSGSVARKAMLRSGKTVVGRVYTLLESRAKMGLVLEELRFTLPKTIDPSVREKMEALIAAWPVEIARKVAVDGVLGDLL